MGNSYIYHVSKQRQILSQYAENSFKIVIFSETRTGVVASSRNIAATPVLVWPMSRILLC